VQQDDRPPASGDLILGTGPANLNPAHATSFRC
jgi:hypothetical protein